MSGSASLGFNHAQLLSETVVASSAGLGAFGLTVQERRQPAAAVEALPATDHLVAFHLGSTFNFAASVDRGPTERVAMRAGDFSLIPAGTRIALEWDAPTHVLHLQLDRALFDRALEAEGSPASARLLPKLCARDPGVEAVARSLLEEIRVGGFGARLYAESLAQALAVQLLRRHSDSSRILPLADVPRRLSESALARATEYIRDNLAANISVEQIAAEAHLSPFHFARLFRESTGCAPHQFLLQARVQRAKELLAAPGRLSIAQIAAEVGFFDQSHFTRHFKRLTGMTPASYRRSAGGG